MSGKRLKIVVDGSRFRYFVGDDEVTEQVYRAACPSKLQEALDAEPLPAQTSAAWPIISDALAVHTSQIEQARARNKRMGCNVDYNEKGQAILTDRGARRDLLKVEGFHDNQGGYGDG